MKQNLENTIALLERTPAALDALLRGLPEMWTETNEGENTWSVRTVIAHLIHEEDENWIPRARMILESGEAQAFAPVDREGHLRYSRDKTLEQLLDALRACAGKGAGGFARTETDCGGFAAARTPPVVWHGDAVRTAGDMGYA
jgi:hypothetical protein